MAEIAGTRAAPGHGILIGALAASCFLVSSHGLALAPFLRNVTDELGGNLALAGALLGVASLAWGSSGLVSGPLSDRFGRKPVLLFGLLAVTVGALVLATAQSYAQAMVGRLLGGLAGGCVTSAAFAAAADASSERERGRALSWVIAGQSLALILGTPLVTLVAAASDWRWGIASIAVAALPTLVALLWLMPGQAPRPRGHAAPPRLERGVYLQPAVLALFAASAVERFTYSSVASFFPTFLLSTYDLSLALIAPALGVVAIGTVLGGLWGGRLADGLGNPRLLVVASLAVAALLALPLLLTAPGPLVSVLLGTLFTVANAVGRPALLAVMSEVAPEHRGAIMGMNVSVNSAGWLVASAVGGLLIELGGFSAQAALVCGIGLLGAPLPLVRRASRAS